MFLQSTVGILEVHKKEFYGFIGGRTRKKKEIGSILCSCKSRWRPKTIVMASERLIHRIPFLRKLLSFRAHF